MPSVAEAHKDDYLTDTFVFVTLDRNELEIEYFLDGQFSPRALGHRLGVEYGFSDHLMGDVAMSWMQNSGGPTAFSGGFVELRYRFGEESQHLLDRAASIEYRVERDPADGETRHLLEPRLVLNKDFGDYNVTLNLAYAIDLEKPGESAPEIALGFRSPAFGPFRAGLELRRELATENVFSVVPQAWVRFSDDAYVKVGFGKNLAASRESFVRVALEMEF
ncbi:MAG TPA: hypothetical protein VLJ18_05810 [Thermoanaerobaculia bacterium]|nr:hypothetical protein [Thermoanaerobaculia bacterium]